MAKIQLSASITAIKGGLSGSLFRSAQNGAIVGNFTYKIHKQTRFNQANKIAIYKASQLWRTISPQQRRSWLEASENDLSGIRLFRQRNYYLLRYSLSPTMSYSVSTLFTSDLKISQITISNNLRFDYTITGLGLVINASLIIKISKPKPPYIKLNTNTSGYMVFQNTAAPGTFINTSIADSSRRVFIRPGWLFAFDFFILNRTTGELQLLQSGTGLVI